MACHKKIGGKTGILPDFLWLTLRKGVVCGSCSGTSRVAVHVLDGLSWDRCRCRIPDDCIDQKRYALFMARDVLKALVQSIASSGRA